MLRTRLRWHVILGRSTPINDVQYEPSAIAARSALGDAAFAAAFAEGRAMTPEQAIEYALSGEPG